MFETICLVMCSLPGFYPYPRPLCLFLILLGPSSRGPEAYSMQMISLFGLLPQTH